MAPLEATEIDSALADEMAIEVPFPVIGVGASAGGLEAFSELLQNIPANPGLCIMLVMHLQPDFKSHLAEILGGVTHLAVQQAVDGVKVEPNSVYIIPPNQALALKDNRIALTPRPPRGQHMPADYLFRSLATAQKSRAIGVILSGGGTDGTLGFIEIKAAGGITFAQDEATAKHDSMPRAAVAEGVVDYILDPAGIARQIVQILRHPFVRDTKEASTRLDAADVLAEIMRLLRQQTDVDFTHYKRTTIRRRIQRRMALRGVDDPAAYVRILRDEPAELHNLYMDFLIRVTQFFRDAEAFEALKEKVFPALMENRPANVPIRIWVAGCATGEEVYSLAISLLEFLSERPEAPSIKILATDLNEAALDKARNGVYIDNIEIDVSAERLRRFFIRSGTHYQICKSVRDLCVFSRQNMASDPPFSRLDLVSCRNVLIYMDGSLQKRVLPVLHYALNPERFLFLGSAESIGAFSELFTPVDGKHRIFQKKRATHNVPLDFTPFVGMRPVSPRLPAREDVAPLWNALEVQREADRIVLGRYAPVGVIIDESMMVLQFRGRTSPYLEPAPGMASLDLLRMLRPGLLPDVRAALAQARTENSIAVRERVLLNEDDQPREVRVEVIPFRIAPADIRFFLVLFQEARPQEEASAPATPAVKAVGSDQQVVQLQQEMQSLRDYLQSLIEEQESTNEELKSANEEILSANEELQSTNEELQTAKEEAQSANEELATLNEELRHRNTEMARVNNDLTNLLSGIGIPIIMVDRDLRIRRFTPMAEKVFNLIPGDMGRPIIHLRPSLKLDNLGPLLMKVIDSLAPHESHVQDQDGHWYTLRIRPYVTTENHIDGATIALLDIDTVKQALLTSDGKKDGTPVAPPDHPPGPP